MKRFCSLILVLSLLFGTLSLTACHGSRALPEFEMPSSFDEAKTYEITFWAKNESNANQRAVYNDAIEAFEALYPNIRVNVKMYTDYGRIYSDVITNIQTLTTPDVCITYPDHVATYITGANIVAPLDALIADERYGLGGSALRFDGVRRDEIVEKFYTEGQIGGVQYALPFMRSTEACYVNRDLVEALGFELPEMLTWDFVFEVARAAMTKDSEGNYINGQKTMIPFIYKSTDNMMIQMLYQLGADYSTDEGDILIFNEDTAEVITMVADAASDSSFDTFKHIGYPGNYLNKGQCIFAIDSTAGATWMGSDAPNLDVDADKVARFETVVMPIPQFDTENPRMISQGPSICVFNKQDPGQVLASWLFAQFLLTNRVQIDYSKTEGYVPVTEKAQRSAEYLDYLASAGRESSKEDAWIYHTVKHEATRLLLDNIDNTFVTPVFNGSASLRNVAGQLIESVTLAARRGRTVDSAYIEELYGSTASLYKLDQLYAQKSELGALAPGSVALIVTLGAVWCAIAAYLIADRVKKVKKARKED